MAIETKEAKETETIETFPAMMLADATGKDIKEIIAMIKTGDILAIECGGTNKPNTYYITQEEIDRVVKEIKEKDEKTVRRSREDAAAVNGRKMVFLRCGLLVGEPFANNEIKLSWIPSVNDMTIESIINEASKHYNADLSFLKALKISVNSTQATVTKDKKISEFEFTEIESGNATFFYLDIEFEVEKPKEEKPAEEKKEEKKKDMESEIKKQQEDIKTAIVEIEKKIDADAKENEAKKTVDDTTQISTVEDALGEMSEKSDDLLQLIDGIKEMTNELIDAMGESVWCSDESEGVDESVKEIETDIDSLRNNIRSFVEFARKHVKKTVEVPSQGTS